MAADYLSSLDDSPALQVQGTGPVDAYEMHLPAAVEEPADWLSFAANHRPDHSAFSG